MTLPAEINPLMMYKQSSAYSINNSLRFRSSASAYMNRTPTVAGNQQIWTWSAWIKRGTLGTTQLIFNASPNASNEFDIFLNSSDQIAFQNVVGGTGAGFSGSTNAVLRDPSSWYHIIMSVDTTQATAANRLIVYVNGVSQSFSAYVVTQNTNTWINSINPHQIGRQIISALYYFDGYMAEINFIDGQALTPSSFGAYDSTTGVWQPKKYTGTYGTNGFYLPFSNNSSVANLGLDFSGNGNNWTPSNFSLTADYTYDWMLDSPTLTSTATRPFGNYSTWNPVDVWGSPTFSNGNLTAVNANSVRATMGTSSTGKWYYEILCGSTPGPSGPVAFGACTNTAVNPTSEPNYAFTYTDTVTSLILYKINGGAQLNIPAGAATPSVMAVLQFAYDASSGNFWIGKNNVWVDSSGGSTGNPSTGANPTVTFNAGTQLFPADFNVGGTAFGGILNCGQQPYVNTPPTGFKSICASNLPTPSIVNGASYMAATLYTGTGSPQTINDGTNTTLGTTFQPDLVWIKSRSNATNNNLFDSVRGVNNYIISNATAAQATNANTLTSFAANGFALGTDAGSVGVNISGNTYVGWNWLAGAGSSSIPTGGTIIPTGASINATAGFSIISYTGTGAVGTVPHGLGASPNFVVIKSKTSTTFSWWCWHSAFVTAGGNDFINLNTNSAKGAGGPVDSWNNTVPNSTVVSLGTYTQCNNSGDPFVMYCWTAIPGFSAFGSYTGNGSTSGPFVYTGFRPRWIMLKRTDATVASGHWVVVDTSTSPYNITSAYFTADTSNQELPASLVNILSNGFSLPTTDASINASGATYIYAAFAENPFKYSLAR